MENEIDSIEVVETPTNFKFAAFKNDVGREVVSTLIVVGIIATAKVVGVLVKEKFQKRAAKKAKIIETTATETEK